MLGSLQTQFWAVRDYLSPVLRDSKFKESGRLTPDEFVAAGDYLVYKFPTWSWQAAKEDGKTRDFLPKEKQYLMQRNVPCLRRVSQLAFGGGGADEDAETMMSFAQDLDGRGADDGEDWVATHTSSKDPMATKAAPAMGDIPDLEEALASTLLSSGAKTVDADEQEPEEMPDMDDIPDIDDDDEDGMGGGLVEEEDESALRATPLTGGKDATGISDNLIQVRTYDCFITYDKYYQTPRFWLSGYDEHKTSLPPSSAFEDVSSDHAQKTVTIEPFPHGSLSMASVHPCKHSSVMKKVIERMDKNVVELQRREKKKNPAGTAPAATTGSKGGKWAGLVGKATGKKEEAAKAGGTEEEGPEGLRVDQYLVVFLKFMSSIVPTIEVDATNSI
ncbi:hypothetical protein MVLG_03946 [Microbotryum lychnidis-dioicae p1A1 Lamole]|uniref:Autophagy-related protein 3 n=1 Tax=Microbotryum lychnidis-dioicae (strain p1A1 Lamole / MvSl-1064) TaxID=683840 RepID=U5H9Q7_USTV1|nr:hypothetical protein MVLG_03946 [Microbotryum lychnidis-dioicae p1A1 Lamole]|eukprot:KDE05712.1 hypothetical protein MVLG_03946 [Microbotryum lychnidis-dioicae p1A1 Lamole]